MKEIVFCLLLSELFSQSFECNQWISKWNLEFLQKQIILQKILLLQSFNQHSIEISSAIYLFEKETGLHHNILISIIQIESGFNPEVISSAGAVGLMQVMPVWTSTGAKCEGKNLKNIYGNIDCGARIFKYYLDIYKNFNLALAAYNRGPTRVDRDLVMGRNPTNEYVRVFNKTKFLIE